MDGILARVAQPGPGRPSRFHQQLLWITGFTQLGDAQALLVMMFLETQIPCAFPNVTVADVNAVTTAVFLGMLLGALAGGGIADSYGRRVTYLLMTLAVGGFSLLSAIVSSFWGLAACRFGVGLGLGAAPAALSLYAEFLPTASRGANIMSFFMFFSVGAVLQSGLAWASLSSLPSDVGWRVMTALSALPCCVLFGIAVCGGVPESPRFLVSKGRTQEALAVLQSAAATNGIKDFHVSVDDITSPDADRESARASSSQWRVLCSNGPVLRSLIILSVTFVIMAMLYYVLILLTNIIVVAAATGRTEAIFGCVTMTATDFVLAMFVNSAEIPGLLIARRLIDRVGRRLTVSGMFAACGVCTAMLWLSLTFGGGSDAANICAVILLFLARTAALGFNQSLWVLSCEAFPTPVRGVGLGIATSFARIGGALAPSLCAAFQHDLSGALLVCTAFAIAGATVIVWFPHETAASDLDGKHASSDVEETQGLMGRVDEVK